MERHFYFWKHKDPKEPIDVASVFNDLLADRYIDSILDVNSEEISKEIRNTFINWNESPLLSFSKGKERFSVFFAKQHIHIHLFDMTETSMNKIITVFNRLGYPLYDDLISTRFIITTPNDLKAKYKEICKHIISDLAAFGFQNKNYYTAFRKFGECEQSITIGSQKPRGLDCLEVSYVISYSYPNLNKIIYMIKNIPPNFVQSWWQTGSINLTYLYLHKWGFHHKVSLLSDVASIAEEATNLIIQYGLPYLSSVDTFEKLIQALISGNNIIAKSVCQLPVCFTLASCYLYSGNKEAAIKVLENAELSDEFAPLVNKAIEIIIDYTIPDV